MYFASSLPQFANHHHTETWGRCLVQVSSNERPWPGAASLHRHLRLPLMIIYPHHPSHPRHRTVPLYIPFAVSFSQRVSALVEQLHIVRLHPLIICPFVPHPITVSENLQPPTWTPTTTPAASTTTASVALPQRPLLLTARLPASAAFRPSTRWPSSLPVRKISSAAMPPSSLRTSVPRTGTAR